VHTPDTDIADIPGHRITGTTGHRTADITEAVITDTTVDITAAGTVGHMAGTAGRTTVSRSAGLGLARGGIRMAILITGTTTLTAILPTIRIPHTRIHIPRIRSIVSRSNTTGTIARIRKVIIRMSKAVPVGGRK
jgi:hypothetical protein